MKLRTLAALTVVLISTIGLQAQSSRTAFMLDNYSYAYRINPAIQGERNFVAIGLGSINVALGSDLGVSSLLFPGPDGGLVTGFNASVPEDKFMKKILDMNVVNASVSENILSMGIWGKRGGFSTFEINVRGDAAVCLPHDAFSFLKEGGEDTAFDLSSTWMRVYSMAEVAYGYSHKIGDKVSFGARVKALVGLFNVNAYFNKATIEVNPAYTKVYADATFNGASTFMNIGTRTSEDGSQVYDFEARTYDFMKTRPSGYGAAIDLGLQIEPFDGFEIDLAINDIGAMRWNYNMHGLSHGETVYVGAEIGLEDPEKNEGKSTVRAEIDEAIDKLEDVYEFHESAATNGWNLTQFTGSVGFKYRFPAYKRLSVGGIYTLYCDGRKCWHDGRVGLAVTPLDGFSYTLNYGYTSSGLTWGTALSTTLLGINFFVAADGYCGSLGAYKFDKYPLNVFYPIDRFRYDVTFGFTIQFGKKHLSKYQRSTEI